MKLEGTVRAVFETLSFSWSDEPVQETLQSQSVDQLFCSYLFQVVSRTHGKASMQSQYVSVPSLQPAMPPLLVHAQHVSRQALPSASPCCWLLVSGKGEGAGLREGWDTTRLGGMKTRPSTQGTVAGLAASQHFERTLSTLLYDSGHPKPAHTPSSTPRHGSGTVQLHDVPLSASATLRRLNRLGGWGLHEHPLP